MARRSNGNGNGRRSHTPRLRVVQNGNGIHRPTARGTLIIIGGHEEKDGEALILRAVAERVGSGKLVVATLASQEPEAMFRDYQKAFSRLGLKRVEHLDVSDREALLRDPPLKLLEGASVVFFTGGGQLRITTQFGGTQLCEQIQQFYQNGGTIAGTSAGASVMSDTMLVSGDGESSHRVGGNLLMAPGLGYLKDVIIDQHFAERGRIGRLLGAVAQNPRFLGIGLDENTAIIVHKEREFRVLGAGAAYVVDGRGVTCTNITEEENDRTISMFNVRLHLLSQGCGFDLLTREPRSGNAEDIEKELMSS
ncbi:MAG: cyanophycinase [Gemmatimonadales bacterium]